jgi:hypothetical protein
MKNHVAMKRIIMISNNPRNSQLALEWDSNSQDTQVSPVLTPISLRERDDGCWDEKVADRMVGSSR